MNEEELGLDTSFEKKDGRLFDTIPTDTPRGKKRKFELDPEAIAHQKAIVYPGPSCYLSKMVTTKGFDSVVKMSWPSNLRPPETELLKEANDQGVKELARLIAYQNEITSISTLRSGLEFSSPRNFRGLPRSCNPSFS